MHLELPYQWNEIYLVAGDIPKGGNAVISYACQAPAKLYTHTAESTTHIIRTKD